MEAGDGTGLAQALKGRSLRDFKPLKTKTFMFDKDRTGINRQMSAHDAYHTTGSSKDFEEVTRIHLGLQELINDKSSSHQTSVGNNFALYPGAKISHMIAN